MGTRPGKYVLKTPSWKTPPENASGDHCVITDRSYGGTVRAARVMFSDLGVTFGFVDFRDPEIVKAAIRPNTKLIFSETPANPTLSLTDLKVGQGVQRCGVGCIITVVGKGVFRNILGRLGEGWGDDRSI